MLSDDQLASLTARFGVQDLRTGGILLVDDEPLNLKILKVFLEDRYRVVTASSGEEALAMVAQAPVDVVISDQRMPGMTGVELLRKLRAVRPDVAGIVLTAYADQRTVESAINEARAFRFLRKPFNPESMLEAVADASAHVAQRRAIEKLVELLAARTEELGASLEQVRSSQEQVLHLERLSTMGQLASGVLHDLRNVTISLRSAEWEISQSPVSPDLAETLRVGMKGIDSLSATLDAMYQFARCGTVPFCPRQVAPAAVVQDALAISRMDRAYRGRTVELTLGEHLPQIAGDQQKLTQVMVNLLRNALQAGSDHSRVRVEAHAESRKVHFAVEDEGPGVPPEVHSRLFLPFVSTKGPQGMGMGLYMARLIVESHHGEISCSNLPQGGARFEVVLPAASEA